MPNKLLSNYNKLLQSVEAKLSLSRDLFKFFILIEIAIKLTLNIKFHESFTSKLKAANYRLIQRIN